jgi:hypothetical protein
MPPDCCCPACLWHGQWEDAVEKVEYQEYGEAFGSGAWKEEHYYFCPVCLSELEECAEAVNA